MRKTLAFNDTIKATYSSCNSIPLSSLAPFESGKLNSLSECSGKGVGASNTSVSTMEPLEDPNDTLQVEGEKDYSVDKFKLELNRF